MDKEVSSKEAISEPVISMTISDYTKAIMATQMIADIRKITDMYREDEDSEALLSAVGAIVGGES